MLIKVLIILDNKANSGHFKRNAHGMSKTIFKVTEPWQNLTVFINCAQEAFEKLDIKIVIVIILSLYWQFKTGPASVGCIALYMVKKKDADVNFLYFYQNIQLLSSLCSAFVIFVFCFPFEFNLVGQMYNLYENWNEKLMARCNREWLWGFSHKNNRKRSYLYICIYIYSIKEVWMIYFSGQNQG